MLCLQKLAKGRQWLTQAVVCSFCLHRHYQSEWVEKVAPDSGQVVLLLKRASIVFQIHF